MASRDGTLGRSSCTAGLQVCSCGRCGRVVLQDCSLPRCSSSSRVCAELRSAHRGPHNSLGVAVRTVALSFASAALGGLVLNAIGVKFNARSWATAMFIITIAAGYVGIRRSETTQPQESAVAPVASTAVLGVAMIALLTAAAVVAYASEHASTPIDHRALRDG